MDLPTPPLPEAEETAPLLARAKAGDERAMEQLFERERPRLEPWVMLRFGAHLRRRLDPEDIVQETLACAFKAIGSFEPKGRGAFYQWLRSIAENRIRDAHDFLRARKRDPAREARLDATLQASRTSPISAMARVEDHERLLETLASLPENHRTILRLVKYEGCSYDEAGEILGITAKAAGVRLVRALQALRSSFEDRSRRTLW